MSVTYICMFMYKGERLECPPRFTTVIPYCRTWCIILVLITRLSVAN